MKTYFNENDRFTAEWLRQLYPNAHVDDRSICDVKATDLVGLRRCHFFAGIGGWEYALHLAGWPADRDVWTGSCPCQPWSTAGAGAGARDPRHLWPTWFRLIRECHPSVVFGEQVPAAIERGWLDAVAHDFESEDYAFASAVCAAGDFGADHERLRLYWVAHSKCARRKRPCTHKGVSLSADAPHAIPRDVFAGARRAVDGNLDGLLCGDGLSVAVERFAIKGYGNAIVPQVAAEFVCAFRESEE